MRTHNDWAALKKAEREGHEEPGTYARLRREWEAQVAAEGNAKRGVDFLSATKLYKEMLKK